jgi:surfeit locus 1 family protein
LPLTIKSQRFYWSASVGMTLLTAAAVATFVPLGLWQWHRAQFKRAQLAQYDAGSTVATPLEHTGVAALPRYTRISVQGRYDVAHQFLLENISLHGLPGYDVLTPFSTPDGRTLMINRGWIAAIGPRSTLPEVGFQAGVGDIRITGRLDDLPVVGLALGHIPPGDDSQWPKLTAFPTMPDLAAVLKRRLEPRQLQLDPDEPDGYQREWQLAGLGPARHLSYAVQWWAFAALALLLFVYLNWHRRRPS